MVLLIIFASMDNSLDPVRLPPYVAQQAPGAGLAVTLVGPGGLPSAMILFLPVWFAPVRAPSGWRHSAGLLLVS